MKRNPPTRQLSEYADLEKFTREAAELMAAVAAGEAAAVAEARQHGSAPEVARFTLEDARHTLARAYGFENWSRLRIFVQGTSEERLVEAVRARAPELVRLLMQRGADARSGVYPHRDATSPMTMALERGYGEIVAIIEEAEQRRREALTGMPAAPDPGELLRKISSGDDERAIAMMQEKPELIQAHHAQFGITPLHLAARILNARLAEWLLAHGADVQALDRRERTPLDLAAQHSNVGQAEQFAAMAALLLGHGAAMTERAAAALGDQVWLRARYAQGLLTNPIEDTGGLLRIAVSHRRPDVLAMLLEFGFDPDERVRYEYVGGDNVVFTWGMPLWECAGTGQYAMAEMLLQRGADPNASVYASGDPVFQAYSQQDTAMVELLERYGGVPEASTAGLFRRTELAGRILAGEAPCRTEGADGETVAERMLWGAACGGDPEIVRMALEHVDWARDDPRWFPILEQPLRIWTHGSSGAGLDRGTYLTCFRLILERCDPNLRGREGFELTILHSVAGSREHVTPEERVAFATMLLDAGARLDARDGLLESTPLGWACRWGRVELVKLFLARGADPVEPEAEEWARPRAWAEKMGHAEVAGLLTQNGTPRGPSA